MSKTSNREANPIVFIIPFLIITAISIIFLIIMRSGLKDYHYDIKKAEAQAVARSISIHLTHTGEAIDAINRLMVEKLTISLKAMGISGGKDYSLLDELADAFELDEVYLYNPLGKIVYSYSGAYLGWTAYSGHPVYDFIDGDKSILIEDIRKDSDSDKYYKYGYIKIAEGFMQIGILADKVQSMMDDFAIQNIIEDMVVDDSILQLSAINDEFEIFASLNKETIGQQAGNQQIMDDVNSGEIHGHIKSLNGEDVYEIFVPLEHRAGGATAFVIAYSMKDTKPLIERNEMIAFAALVVIYLSLTYSMLVTYKNNKKLVRLTLYDSVTGLPNTESLKRKMAKYTGSGNNAVLVIKFDNLTLINLTYGYDFGVLLLKELANRAKAIESEKIHLFRFVAEYFVLHIKDYHDKYELLHYTEKLEELLGKPFIINDTVANLTYKIGIMEYKGKDMPLEQMLKDATIAADHVRAKDDHHYSFFDESMEQKIKREDEIEREIRAAISGQEKSGVYVVYQPVVDAVECKIVGFEALARMNSKQLGSVSPMEFIRIAEKKQLIDPLSKLITGMAFTFVSDLLKLGYDDMRVSVNISAGQLLREDFVAAIMNIIGETGISGRNVALEITESAIMENHQLVNSKLKELRSKGIRISIDDFGTGYSSFSRLRELNVDTLKIDRSFIVRIGTVEEGELLTKDIVSIAHRLGLKTIAEGVELPLQRDYLVKSDCDMLQGYMFGKPIPKEDTIALLQTTEEESTAGA